LYASVAERIIVKFVLFQNIFSSNNVMVLEILWQAVGMQTPGERVCTLLVEFTLAVAVSSTISYNIWKLIDSRAIQMVAFQMYIH